MGPELMDVMKTSPTFWYAFLLCQYCKSRFECFPLHIDRCWRQDIQNQGFDHSNRCFSSIFGTENEIRLQGYGVSACATCDGFFYRGEEVAVVGGGDSACEEANFLTKFATTVHMFVRRDELRASKIMADRVLNNDKVKIYWNTELVDVLGEKEVTGVRVINNKTQEESDITLKGLFLAIGHTPNSSAFVGLARS